MRQMLCFLVANGNHAGISDELIESKMLAPIILLNLMGTFKFHAIVSFKKPSLRKASLVLSCPDVKPFR